MKRYTPDFPEMMRLCETNFAQLRRLLPRTDAAGDVGASRVDDLDVMACVFRAPDERLGEHPGVAVSPRASNDDSDVARHDPSLRWRAMGLL